MPSQNNLINQYYDAFVGMQLQALDPKEGVLIGQKALFFAKHKETIIKQALFNLGFKTSQRLTDEQLAQFKTELNNILPTFDKVPSFFKNGDELESLTQDMSQETIRKITARNYLRLFMRGSKVGEENDWVWNSPLFTQELVSAIADKGPHDLLKHVRTEIQDYLDNVYDTMSKGGFSKAQATLVHKHLFPLLASLVFFDDPAKTTIFVPVKIGDAWHRVEYNIQKLDISPKPTDSGLDGMIARKLKDEDRFQMYGLTPAEPNTVQAKPILLLNGTPPPGCAGADLAAIHNFGIGQSVGESHNWDNINAWVKARKDIVVYGHSKGGSMAQIVAAENPDHIYSVDALCAPGLHSTTLKRLRKAWETRRSAGLRMPIIRLYHQPGDPVFHFEQGFLPGSEIRHVLTNKDSAALNAYPIPAFFSRIWEGHSFPSLGYDMVGYLKGSCDQENKRELRSFLDTVKGIKNYFTTLEFKVDTYLQKTGQELSAYLTKHKKGLLTALFVATVVACAIAIGFASMGVGFLVPASIALANIAGSQLGGIAIMGGIALVGSAALTYFKALPKLVGLAVGLTLNLLNKAYGLVAFSTMVVLSIPSALKNGGTYLYRHPETIKEFGKYMLSLKFLTDIVTNIVKGVAFLGESSYIGLNVLYRVVRDPWYKPRAPEASKVVGEPAVTSALTSSAPSSLAAEALKISVRSEPALVSNPKPSQKEGQKEPSISTGSKFK